MKQALVVFGAMGRMGQTLIEALDAAADLRLAAAVASPQSMFLGREAAIGGRPTGVFVTADAKDAVRGAAVAVDFSAPQAAAAHAAICAEAGVPLLVGTTGLDAGSHAALQAAAERIAVLVAPNTSVGLNVALRLAAFAAGKLDESFDVEVIEAHHRMKRDAPSGTALALGAAVAQARGLSLERAAVYARDGEPGPRRPGSIGFAVVRAGDIIGEHTVVFAGDGERIEITHKAGDRRIFARGALRAAAWLIGRKAGYYGMTDVLDMGART